MAKYLGKDLNELLSVDRPAVGINLSILYKIFDLNFRSWFLYELIIHIFSALLFFIILKLIFPNNVVECLLAAILFLTYPGFLQQYDAVIYQTHFFTMLLFFLSILSTIGALKTKKWKIKIPLIAFSIVLQFAYLSLLEYFIGLEVLRILVIYFFARKQAYSPNKWKQLVFALIPYIFGLLIFLFWRLEIFSPQRVRVDETAIIGLYLSNPKAYILKLLISVGQDLLDLFPGAYSAPLSSLVSQSSSTAVISAVLVSISTVVLFIISAGVIDQYNSTNSNQKPKRSQYTNRKKLVLFSVSLLTLLVIMVPINFNQREISFEYGFDRYTIPTFIVVVGFIVFFLSQLKSRKFLWYGLCSSLIVVSIMTQVLNTNYFGEVWSVQKGFWWQLIWRAPGIKRGTVLIPSLPKNYGFWYDYEIFPLANRIYYPEENTPQIVSVLLDSRSAYHIANSEVSEKEIRTVIYTRDYEKSLIISLPKTGGCIHVLDSQQLEVPLSVDPYIFMVASRSKIDNIEVEEKSISIPTEILGEEPAHDWCYFYQKASLARQRHDWDTIVELGDQVISMDLQAKDPIEWAPFLEGYAYKLQNEKYYYVLSKVKQNEFIQKNLCIIYHFKSSDENNVQTMYNQVSDDLCQKYY